MLYITSPPSIVHPIRAEQKNIDKWFIHQKGTGSADLKNSCKTGSNPSKCFYWISLSLSHTHRYTFTFPVKASFIDSVLLVLWWGQSWRKWKAPKFILLFCLDPDLLLLAGPSHQAAWSLTIPPAYSFPTGCGVTTYLLGPRGIKITFSAMTSDPSAGAAKMSVLQAWTQWIGSPAF